MLLAIDKDKNRKIAWETEKTQSPFFCPICNSLVILRKGYKNIHHFSHKPPVICTYGLGETNQHLTVKYEIYKALIDRPNTSKCELERVLKRVRPDISLYIGETPVAIEIQRSNIRIDEIERRTKQYSNLGIYLLWVLPDSEPNKAEYLSSEDIMICRPNNWQKYLHAMYFGRLYFWEKEDILSIAHLSDYKTPVVQGNWVEDYEDKIGDDLSETDWYQENWNAANYGGYSKISRSKKIVMWAEEDDPYFYISTDFKSLKRDSFDSKNWSIPASKIWIDRLGKWW